MRRRHSLTCAGTTPAVTFPPTCLAHFAAGGEGRAGGWGRWGDTGPYLGSSGCRLLVTLWAAERYQGWEAKLLPILSSLTLSADDGKDPLTPTLIPPLHAKTPWAHQGDARFIDRSHGPLSRAAKQSSTKPPLLALFGSDSSTAAGARSQLSQCSRKNGMCFTPCAGAFPGGHRIPESYHAPASRLCHYPAG